MADWELAHETVYGHLLFSEQHSLNSIKTVVKLDYHFKNDIDEVILIGYDNGEKIKKSEKENELLPVGSFPPSERAITFFHLFDPGNSFLAQSYPVLKQFAN